MSSVRTIALGALLLATGCVTPMTAGLPTYQDFMLPTYADKETVETELGQIVIEVSRENAGEAALLKQAVLRAAPAVARWGKLEDPVRLIVARDHQELEVITGQLGIPWLKAFARYGDLLLQSPASFPKRPPTPDELNEILVHELTHCVMFQRSATMTSWRRKGIPLWFREGMAMVTAGQGYQFPAVDDLAQYYKNRPDLDPISAPEALYRGDQKIVYAAAHHAFAFLLKRYGEPQVNQLLDAMKGGLTFPDAFKSVIGISPGAFLSEFKRYVRWGGYKQAPKSVRPRTSEATNTPLDPAAP